jgi:hypothetical protein
MPKTYQKLTVKDFSVSPDEVISQAEARQYFNRKIRIWKDFLAAGWIKPFNETPGSKRRFGTIYYLRSDVIKAWQRFLDGEYPGRKS